MDLGVNKSMKGWLEISYEPSIVAGSAVDLARWVGHYSESNESVRMLLRFMERCLIKFRMVT